MHGLNEGFGEIAAGNAGLIGDDDDGEIALVEAANGSGGEGKEAKAGDVVEIADFIGDGAVAVEEDRRPERTRVRQKPPPRQRGEGGQQTRPFRE